MNPTLNRQEIANITADNLTLRNMASADLADVLSIERNAQVSPWSRLSFEESLTKEHVCRVVTHNNKVLAFHVVCAVVDELHILNVAVASHLQGIGLGHVLMQDIIETAESASAKKVFLEVRASNLAAQSLYAKWQFEQIALRKGYYRSSQGIADQREDALVFARNLL